LNDYRGLVRLGGLPQISELSEAKSRSVGEAAFSLWVRAYAAGHLMPLIGDIRPKRTCWAALSRVVRKAKFKGFQIFKNNGLSGSEALYGWNLFDL
jgi:hypothetical protein